MNAKIGAKRLLKLADFLAALPPEKFDLNHWQIKKRCGTVCCALGWATHIPSFRRLGLSMGHDNVPQYIGRSYGCSPLGSASQFFGMLYSDAEDLFDPEQYPPTHRNLSYVVRRIRTFAKKRLKELNAA